MRVCAAAWLLVCLAGAPANGQPRPSPRVLLDADDLARIAGMVERAPWAAENQTAIIRDAGAWEAAHLQKYGLKEWAPAPEGGQWSHWYVCPKHGSALTYRPPDQHVCAVDNERFSGYPYDQVILARRNSDSGAAIRDNGLAWQFTKNPEYARSAARILLAYADIYSTYKLHDTNNRADTRTGGRAFAQTLDESVWLIPVAWGYDMIQASGVLTEQEKAHIEKDLLRAAVATIQRNDAGMSNWQ